MVSGGTTPIERVCGQAVRHRLHLVKLFFEIEVEDIGKRGFESHHTHLVFTEHYIAFKQATEKRKRGKNYGKKTNGNKNYHNYKG